MSRVIYDPTDTLNDAQGLQAAIDQAGPGGRVDIAQGRLRLNATVHINAALMMTGCGTGTMFIRAPGFAGNLLEVRSASGLIIRDFAVDDACSPELRSAEVGAQVINLWNCPDTLIDNIRIKNCFRGGIIVSECDGAVVHKCLVEDTLATPMPPQGQSKGGHGITVFAREGQICRNVTISNCTLRRNWRTGIFLVGSTQVRVESCALVDNMPKASFDAGIEPGGQIGVWAGCYDVVVANNTIEGGFDAQGVEIDVTQQTSPGTAHNVTVVGNTIRNQGRTGIVAFVKPNTPMPQRSARVAIVGNILDNCTLRNNNWYGAITMVEGVSDFTITGNVVREIGQAALKLRGQNLHWVVVGNHLETVAATVPGRPGVFFDGNQSASGTTGQIGVGVVISNGGDVLSAPPTT